MGSLGEAWEGPGGSLGVFGSVLWGLVSSRRDLMGFLESFGVSKSGQERSKDFPRVAQERPGEVPECAEEPQESMFGSFCVHVCSTARYPIFCTRVSFCFHVCFNFPWIPISKKREIFTLLQRKSKTHRPV